MSKPTIYHLFDAVGVELEYMVVSHDSMDVLPITDKILNDLAGSYVCDVDRGEIALSNELVVHVIEFKVAKPVPNLDKLAHVFQGHIRDINSMLEKYDAFLLPSGAHPWMNPREETHVWPHEYAELYETFNRIFGCRTHGWANLQALHINLPFADDEEFGRLHAAIRLVLPILPALAASTPILDGHFTGWMDTRLFEYQKNSAIIPAITGKVIPEPVFTAREYEEQILQRIYADIREQDTEHMISEEWLNARGAIARFERNTIEIRVIDMQECPQADLAISSAVYHLLKAMISEQWMPLEEQMAWGVSPLYDILMAVARDADECVIENSDFLKAFGCKEDSMSAGELWKRLIPEVMPPGNENLPHLQRILEQGPLARRISRAVGPEPAREDIERVYRTLGRCLAKGCLFDAEE